MGRFYQALQRIDAEPMVSADAPQLRVNLPSAPPIATVTAPPAVPGTCLDIAQEASIRQLSEQLLAGHGQTGLRLIVSGCGPGDGASSVVAALAIDITQRLGARTLLVDAHARHPSLERIFARREISAEAFAGVGVARRASGFPRLEILSGAMSDHAQLAREIDRASSDYSICIIDAGAIRLEPALLGFIDGNAPVLLVARYGHTERKQLINSVHAVRAAGRRAIGVVFNAVKSPLPAAINRIFEAGE